MITLGKSKENCSWHVFTVSILEVLNNFMKNLLITKSSDFKSVLMLHSNNSRHTVVDVEAAVEEFISLNF